MTSQSMIFSHTSVGRAGNEYRVVDFDVDVMSDLTLEVVYTDEEVLRRLG